MKASAFRVLVILPLLISLFANFYQPTQAASLSGAAIPSGADSYTDLSLREPPARPGAEALSLADRPAAEPLDSPFAAPQPAPLAALPNPPVLVSPADGATLVSSPVTLKVHVSDPDGGSIKVSFYGRKLTSDTAPNFIFAALPDTQNYVETASGEAIFDAMTQYIANNQTARNIAFVTHLGDITNNGDLDTDQSEWIVADNAMKILERSSTTYADDVPYSMMPGNHDDNGGGLVNYNTFFGVSRFSGRPWYGGHYGTDNSTNYSTFSASGMHFIVINIACFSGYPTAGILNWADSLLKDDVSRRGIVACHSALNPDGSFSYMGQAVFDALKDNPNLFLIVAGHAGVARRQDVGTDGHTIYSVMSDYSGYANGGDGWFRMYQFQPANNQVQVLTYSPTHSGGSYLTGSTDQFILPYDMRSPDFNLIGSTTVSSGSDASVPWSGLLGGVQYEWYAVARDATDVAIGTTQSFVTGPSSTTPLAENDNCNTDEDHTLTVSAPGVLSNDSDPDGKTLTAIKLSDPANGTVSLSSSGGFTYTPDANFNGTDSFTYKASDGTSSDTATVSIVIDPVNDSPVAAKDYPTTLEDTPVVIDVLANDTDIDGDTLTLSWITSAPLYGKAVIQTDNTILYTPNPKFYGTDSFRYSIKDGNGGTASAKVTVTVTHVNHAPEASDGSITTAEDKPVAVHLDASDYDNDSLTYTIVDAPDHGRLSGTAPNLIYTPDANYNGPDGFTFKAKDAALYSSLATVTITVTPVNDAPTCENLTPTVSEDNSLDVIPSCSDVEGTSIEISLASAPKHGKVTLVDGIFHYQPDANYNGSDTFTYQASDGQLDSAPADVDVTITSVDDPPVCQELSGSINEDNTLLDEPLCQDVDSPSLDYVIDGQPQHGQASVDNGKLRYQPAAKFYGTDSFSYKAFDGELYSESEPVWVTINEVIYPPVLGSISPLSVNEGSPLSFNISVTPGDVPLSSLAFRLAGDVPEGAALSSSGVFTWMPTEAQGPGSYTFNVCVDDGTNPSVCQPVTVTVGEVNQAPVLADFAHQLARRGTALMFTASAEDGDLPENTLTFTLQGNDAPPGAALDPSTGVFTWKPNAGQELHTYQFEICVSDGTEKVCKPVSISVAQGFFLPFASFAR